jgi:hypothetical protein
MNHGSRRRAGERRHVSADAIGTELHTVIAANQPVAHELTAGEWKGTVRAAVTHCNRSASFRSPEHYVNAQELASKRGPTNLLRTRGSVPAVADEWRGMVCEIAGIMRLHRSKDLSVGWMGQFGMGQFNGSH